MTATLIAFRIASLLDMPFSSKEKIVLQCSRKFPLAVVAFVNRSPPTFRSMPKIIVTGDLRRILATKTCKLKMATAWVPLKITSLLCFGQNVGPTNWLGEQLLVALEFDIAAIHDPSKCDQTVSYGNPNASVQITLAFEGGHYKLVDPNPDVKLPEKGSNMVAEAEEGYGMAAPRVVEPRVKFQALLANPGYLAVLPKRGFLGLLRLAPSKLLLRLGL